MICKESGVLIATKKKISCINVTTTTHKNIMTSKVIIKNTPFRIIAAYGLQESRSSEERAEFFDELSIEVENSILHNDNPIIVGDLNAKITTNYNDLIEHISPNGKLLSDVVNEHSLNVLNFHPKCQGQWTRSMIKKGVLEESVLDYVITNGTVLSMVENIVIDEERVMTPYTLNAQNKSTSTDHNAILTNFAWSVAENPGEVKEKSSKVPSLGWKITREGLGEFYSSTNEDSPEITCQTYDELEEYITRCMDHCFEKRKQPKLHLHERVRTDKLVKLIDNLKPMIREGKIQKGVAKEYIELVKEIELRKVQNIRYSRISKTLNQLENEDGEISIDEFWKIKKSVSVKTEEKTSILTKNGAELFNEEAILNEYAQEFKNRLSHNQIDEYLTDYEIATKQLVELYFKLAKTNPCEPDYTDEEVDEVLHSLKSGKSPGMDMLPPDVFKASGTNLNIAIKNIMNSIKNTLNLPKSWMKVLIVTFYKNKGSRKMLKNHRGVFLTAVLSKVMEKLIKKRINPKLGNIDPLQCGGQYNKSTSDSLFLVRATIDHSKYLNRTLYLTFYDYRTCFDSLWLEDCMISLWKIGINNDMFSLIYKMNESCEAIVKTPYGNTPPFRCPQIVKQGTVLGGSLCGSSTAELCKEIKHGGAPILSEIIKTVLFVDDSTTANIGFNDTIDCHEKVVLFSKRKNWELNETKCVLLVINEKKSTPPPSYM